ncbi:hypothetical protein BJV77DRAFT_1062177 [Russula vinacea]|nr:hypothetical protein BJV77DRAFT_1062177 [Russula vinacea]
MEGQAHPRNIEDEVPTGRKRQVSKATLEKQKLAAKKRAKKYKDDDDDYEDDGDEYTALSKSFWTSKSSNAKPSVGSLEKCAKCSKQFTVTKYTVAADPPPGFLCHPCVKASGTDPFKKRPAPRKRKSAAEKRSIVNYQEKKFPTLVSLCIKLLMAFQIISKHINDVEAFGDIGSVNLDKIIRVLCRNRSLTPENVTLFYDVKNTSLNVYDGTKLEPPALITLALLNPNLTSLRIDFCGHIDDVVLNAWSRSLPSLVRLELLGPFLVRVPGWVYFFQSHPQLEALLLHQSPRFDLECMSALAACCPNLTQLQLKEIGKLDDTFLPYISCFQQLEQLDLSSPSTSCSEDGMIALLEKCGDRLTHLDLSNHIELGDDFLKYGLQEYAPNLVSLRLDNLPALTDEGVAIIARAPNVGTQALPALLDSAGSTLSTLSINAWRETTAEALESISSARELRMLDVGWNRAVDNFVIKAIMDGCPKLEEIKCYGCNRVTANCPRKMNVNLLGVESYVYAAGY